MCGCNWHAVRLNIDIATTMTRTGFLRILRMINRRSGRYGCKLRVSSRGKLCLAILADSSWIWRLRITTTLPAIGVRSHRILERQAGSIAFAIALRFHTIGTDWSFFATFDSSLTTGLLKSVPKVRWRRVRERVGGVVASQPRPFDLFVAGL